MQVIPPEVGAHVKSDAERTVHRLLRECELDGWTALHSLRLARHEYQQVGEVDFLLVGPEGIFVLEVKGGRVSHSNGRWVHRDRFGEEHRTSRSPFTQAQQGAFSLLSRVKETVPSLGRVRIGWGVSFPDQPFPDKSVEWDPAEVIDRDDHETPARFEAAIRRMINLSRRSDTHNGVESLKPAAVQAVLKLCRPDFDRVPTLSDQADALARRTVSMTESQYRFMDAVGSNDRIVCAGGAGTGKTFLALEVLRREVAQGRSVLLTARSRQVAGFLRSQYGGAPDDPGKVVPFDQIAVDGSTFDVLVVDEGQDVLNLDDLTVIDSVLVGGLASGRWRVFLDPNHQSGLLGAFDEDALDLLRDAGAVRIDLPDNCRNPTPVVTDVTRVLGVDVGGAIVGNGPMVTWRWYDGPDEGAQELSQTIDQLLDEGADRSELVILTDTDPLSDTVLARLDPRLRSIVHPVSESTPWRSASHIRSARLGLFKGLEAPFVIVLATGGLDATQEQLRNALYVAMTRATTGLNMVLPRPLLDNVGQLGGVTR